MSVAFLDTWVPNGPFAIVEGDDVGGGVKSFKQSLYSLPIGHIQCVPGSSLADGQLMVLDDGPNPAVQFETDSNGSVVETPVIRAINYSSSDSVDQVGESVANAINNAPALDITATHIGGGAVRLDQTAGTFGAHSLIIHTTPFTTMGMYIGGQGSAGNATNVYRVSALNNVPPHLRRTGMIVYIEDTDGNFGAQPVVWDGANFNLKAMAPSNAGIIDSQWDGQLAYMTPDEGIRGFEFSDVIGSGNERGLSLISEASATQAARLQLLGRNNSNQTVLMKLFAGQADNYNHNVQGVGISDTSPHFVIGEDRASINSANISEIFEVRLPVPGDGTETRFNFNSLPGPSGLRITIDSGIDATRIEGLANQMYLDQNGSGPLWIRSRSAGANQVKITTGATDIVQAHFSNNVFNPTEFKNVTISDSGDLLPTTIQNVQGGQVLTLYRNVNNSALSFQADPGELTVVNENATIGAFSQINLHNDDELGSYPGMHIFSRKRVASVDDYTENGWAVSKGLAGGGKKLIWFHSGDTVQIGGNGGANEMNELFQFRVELPPTTGVIGNVMRFSQGGGDGHLEITVDDDGGTNVCYLSNPTDQTDAPSSTASILVMRYSAADVPVGMTYMEFSANAGEVSGAEDVTKLINTGRTVWVADGTGTGPTHTAEQFDAVRVRVNGNVRWLRCFYSPDPY